MIQVYEYFIQHHLAKGFESYIGSVTCVPGCFCMYRLKYNDGTLVLAHPNIIKQYSEIAADTLHKKNLLDLGEDRFLTTLFLKNFPGKRIEFHPQAVSWTRIPETFRILLSQRRRWVNSTFHNLTELVRLKTLPSYGWIFSFRFFVMIDVLGCMILPALTMYLYYMIIKIAMAHEWVGDYAVIVAGFVGVHLIPSILFLHSRDYQNYFWMLVYFIIGKKHIFFNERCDQVDCANLIKLK